MFDLAGIKAQAEATANLFTAWFSNVGSSNFGNGNTFHGPLVDFARAVAGAKGWM